MEDHRRRHPLKLRWVLFLGAFGLFYLGDVLKNFSYEKKEREALSETKTFFRGSDQEVEVYSHRGREAGPTVLIFSGIHGDESAGYQTADRYVGLKVLKGNLIVVPRLNLYAILTRKRAGLSGGDMNRKFQPSERGQDPDERVVRLAQSLMDRADIILNLHQGHGFYSPVWIDSTRNPMRWGQCNVIDIPIFSLPDGRRLELERFAREVVQEINGTIGDKNFHFQVNNTNTFSKASSHKEQTGSLTYYALAHKHKMAFGIEVTRNCPLPQAISYLSSVVNTVLRRAGIQMETFPSLSPEMIGKELKGNEEFSGLRIKINHRENVIPPTGEILLAPGDRLRILSVEARHPRGWYPSMPGFNIYNGLGREFSIQQVERIILQKDGKRVAVFPIRLKENFYEELRAGT